MKSLVIVESPSKAKTIKKYLGKGYEVKASKGHVVDLPKSKVSVDVENNFKPNYEVTKPKVLKELKKAYKASDKLVLAVDLDREGEAIAWHIAQELGAITPAGNAKKGKNVERIVFSEITEEAIQEAIKNPRSLNMDLVNAQQARRILDRLVGYNLSPVLWKKISFGLSAGRVQSVALRLIVEKEEERRAFDPEEYWDIVAYGDVDKKGKTQQVNIFTKEELDEAREERRERGVKKKDPEGIPFNLEKFKGKKIELKKKSQIDKILDAVKKKDLVIDEVSTSQRTRQPKAPFITSTLQQAAVNTLGFSSKKTMSVAQKLYEKGFITYMRTDSTNLSKQSIAAARKHISSKFGEKYLPGKPNVYSKKSKAAQEAHEAIRPVDVKLENDKGMTPEMNRLYKLIRGRMLSSQMVPARIEQNSVTAKIGDYSFKATGSRVLFDGFMRATGEKTNEVMLPELKEGDKVPVRELNAAQHFTQPPARYSEASIIKKLEELGIGRPSTYSSIISTIISRKYVEKEGRYLQPTITGETVNKLLTKYFKDVVDYDFTANMEDTLDEIAEGKVDWIKMLKDFYKPFEKLVTKNSKDIPREEFTVLGDAPKDIKCPICKSKMQIKLGRYGQFYSCSKWPDCKGMRSIDGRSEDDIAKTPETKEFKESYESAPKTEDGRDYIYKEGKFGGFWAHPDYPKVKDAQPLKYKRKKLVELYGEPPKTDDKKDYVLRNGRYGEFWAHPDYPKKKDIIRIPKKKKED